MAPPVRIDCLGSGDYRVVVKRRRTRINPEQTIGEVIPRSLNWERALSATSVADATMAVRGNEGAVWARCCDVVHQLRPARALLEFWRDDDLVWKGSARVKKFDPDTAEVTLSASDLSIWLSWRAFHHALKPRGLDLADIFDGYLRYLLLGQMPAFGDPASSSVPLYQDDPGLTWETVPTGIVGDRTIAAHDLRMGDAEIGELAATGCDWTVTNTKMWIGAAELAQPGAPSLPLRLPGHITDEFFASAPATRQTSDNMATMPWLRANGHIVHAGGPDPDDGVLIERVLDEYSIEDAASAQAAVDAYYALSHQELTFVEGDNMLAARAPVNIQTLIPGTRTSMALEGGGCVPYDGWLRLDHVTCNLSAEDGEKVSVTFQPLGSSFDARGGN